jgi:hypothetical protein
MKCAALADGAQLLLVYAFDDLRPLTKRCAFAFFGGSQDRKLLFIDVALDALPN